MLLHAVQAQLLALLTCYICPSPEYLMVCLTYLQCSISMLICDAGAYLCVKGYGSTASTYSLRAVYTQCPSDFTEDGKEMLCSSLVNAPESQKRYTGCSADGVCSCKAPFQKPLPEVYDGKSLSTFPKRTPGHSMITQLAAINCLCQC